LLRSRYVFLVAPFAPSMLAAVDLAKAENAHRLGASVLDNFATDFDLGGHGFTLSVDLLKRRCRLNLPRHRAFPGSFCGWWRGYHVFCVTPLCHRHFHATVPS
jgi:hypothetical protein